MTRAGSGSKGAGGAQGAPGRGAGRGAGPGRFRPSRRTFVAMLGAAAAAVMLRDRLSGREVIRNPATGKPIWIGHV